MKDDNIRMGKTMFEEAAKRKGYTVAQLLTPEGFKIVSDKYLFDTQDEMFASIGCGSMSANQIIVKIGDYLRKIMPPAVEVRPFRKSDKGSVRIENMMQVYKIYPSGFAANSYLVTADGKNALCIDPAQPGIADEVKKLGLTVSHVLLTHGHFDHIGGAASLQKAGAKVGCLFGEERLAVLDNLADSLGGGLEIEPFFIDFTVKDGVLTVTDVVEYKGKKE